MLGAFRKTPLLREKNLVPRRRKRWFWRWGKMLWKWWSGWGFIWPSRQWKWRLLNHSVALARLLCLRIILQTGKSSSNLRQESFPGKISVAQPASKGWLQLLNAASTTAMHVMDASGLCWEAFCCRLCTAQVGMRKNRSTCSSLRGPWFARLDSPKWTPVDALISLEKLANVYMWLVLLCLLSHFRKKRSMPLLGTYPLPHSVRMVSVITQHCLSLERSVPTPQTS